MEGPYEDGKAVQVQAEFHELLKKHYTGDLRLMHLTEKRVLEISYGDGTNFSTLLQEALTHDFLRYEPYLKRACKKLMMELYPTTDPNMELCISISNFPFMTAIRDVLKSVPGSLTKIRGLITGSTESTDCLIVRLIGSDFCSVEVMLRGDIKFPKDYFVQNVGDFVSFTGCIAASPNMVALGVQNHPSLTGKFQCEQKFIAHRVDIEKKLIGAELPYGPKSYLIKDSHNDNFYMRNLVNGITPTISGHLDIKEAILHMLMGDVGYLEVHDDIPITGNIHVCLLGVNSTKSEFLKATAKQFERSVYTSGKLTAQDPETGEIYMDACALMFAHRGILCIDELDTMSKSDQDVVYEVMEHQKISINKEAVNLKASIFATANLKGGQYDMTKSLEDNVALPPCILAKFDLVFLLTEDGSNDEPFYGTYDENKFNDYFTNAPSCQPMVSNQIGKFMIKSYESLTHCKIVRPLEALIRLSVATARINFDNEHVNRDNVESALRLLKKSMISLGSAEHDMAKEKDEAGIIKVKALKKFFKYAT